MNDEKKAEWKKVERLAFQRKIVEPMLDAVKKSVEHEKDELVRKLTNLKRLGVIKISKAELDKKLEEMKF